MIKALTVALLVGTPALAAEAPKPISSDSLVCERVYDPNQVTAIHLLINRETTVEISPNESVENISGSDTAFLLTSVYNGKSIFWLKPTQALSPQPLTIVTNRRTDDHSSRIYLIQTDAREPEAPISDNVSLVAIGDESKIKAEPKPCYLIRYIYPGDAASEAAAKAATARQARIVQWRAVHNAALLHDHSVTNQNVRYIGQGDRNLAPDRIFDDGYSTFLEFDGNRPVPAPYEVGFGGKDTLLSGWNAEENVCPGGTAPAATCLKLHDVLKQIRLRDREDLEGKKPSLIITNRAFDPVGRAPGTGTSSPDVKREVTAK